MRVEGRRGLRCNNKSREEKIEIAGREGR